MRSNRHSAVSRVELSQKLIRIPRVDDVLLSRQSGTDLDTVWPYRTSAGRLQTDPLKYFRAV